MLFLFHLALQLGRTVEELMQISVAEFRGWAAYFTYMQEQEKRQQQRK